MTEDHEPKWVQVQQKVRDDYFALITKFWLTLTAKKKKKNQKKKKKKKKNCILNARRVFLIEFHWTC
jgi:hypothetical protein